MRSDTPVPLRWALVKNAIRPPHDKQSITDATVMLSLPGL